MTEFAAHLGLRHTAISRYEAGKLTPSASVLMNLYRLASNTSHKLAIRGLLGNTAVILEKEDRLEVEASRLNAQLKTIISSLQKGPEAAERFSDLAVAIVSDPDGVPLWLCELIQLWFKLKDDQQTRPEFENLVHRAVMKLGNWDRSRSGA